MVVKLFGMWMFELVSWLIILLSEEFLLLICLMLFMCSFLKGMIRGFMWIFFRGVKLRRM